MSALRRVSHPVAPIKRVESMCDDFPRPVSHIADFEDEEDTGKDSGLRHTDIIDLLCLASCVFVCMLCILCPPRLAHTTTHVSNDISITNTSA